MSTHLSRILEQWYEARDECRWVLGTVYATEGSSYRKAGAMMLFNDLGQQYGLLSGGCLESDIHRQARRVMESGRSATLCYDGSDEDDIAFQLGIGCGGTVYILLQPLDRAHDYLALPGVYHALRDRTSGVYRQRIGDRGEVESLFLAGPDHKTAAGGRLSQRGHLHEDGEGRLWLETPVKPPPLLLVVGGGVDARPLVAMAGELGWDVLLCDPRPANARRDYFPAARAILRCRPGGLAGEELFPHIDAAVIMSHNLALDADALAALADARPAYIALLGPLRRRDQVLELAGLSESDLPVSLASPAGLDLGAELPEGVALSILAECHSVLAGSGGERLSDPLRRRRPIAIGGAEEP